MRAKTLRVERRGAVLALLLAAAAAALFWPAGGFEFLNYDDDQYVTHNPRVTAGLTGEGVAWAFTSVGYASNWHPLTWLSLMLDAGIGGGSPALFHATNLALHAANVLLLFHVLLRMTRGRWRSAVVAALFAVHPRDYSSWLLVPFTGSRRSPHTLGSGG